MKLIATIYAAPASLLAAAATPLSIGELTPIHSALIATAAAATGGVAMQLRRLRGRMPQVQDLLDVVIEIPTAGLCGFIAYALLRNQAEDQMALWAMATLAGVAGAPFLSVMVKKFLGEKVDVDER